MEPDSPEFLDLVIAAGAGSSDAMSAQDYTDFRDRIAAQEEEEAARLEKNKQIELQKRLEAFSEGPIEGTFVCDECSALVRDKEVHVDFHESLSKTASEASQAVMWNTPIG
jgi:rubrerythrin